jgi:hypothetical protein
MSGPGQIVGLAEAIDALRAALTDAVERGKEQSMQFRVQPIELTLQAVVTKDANGKIGWGALGVGGSYDSARTQTLTLKLQPVWKTPDGALVEDFTIASQSAVPQHVGPRPEASGGPGG